MKQVNFSHEGGFPLEQETLERLQAAYRSELFGALKAHLSIDNYQNYIVAHATNYTKGWAIIQEDESKLKDSGRALPITDGILYPINKGENTGYLKSTRTGTNLIYGTGVSQIAYYDYEAAYINESEFVSGVAQDSDALKISYHNLRDFKTVKDIHTIEEILEAIEVNIDAIETNINQIEAKITQIESDIDAINQTYLPLDGSKAMKGDLNLDIYKLSKLDTKESGFAIVRSADFRLGSITRKGLLNPNDSTGRALADTSNESKTSLSINYQSDWSTTNIGGKVHLKDVDTSLVDFMASESSDNSMLLMDTTNQILKSNNLLNSLLSRITKLEKQPATNVPIGMIAIWGKPAPFPEGWEEYVPLRGKMPVGLYNPNANERTVQIGQRNNYENLTFYNKNGVFTWPFDTLGTEGGKVAKSLTIDEMPAHSHDITLVDEDGVGAPAGGKPNGIANGTGTTKPAGKSQSFSLLNPYSVVHFIEYTGVASDKTPPTKPNLIISNIGTTTISLSWTASTDNVAVTNYILYRSGALPIQLGNVLEYNVSELLSGTNYSFYITAHDAAGNSSTSNTVNETTKSIVEPTIPTLPTYPKARFTNVNRILIDWIVEPNNVGNFIYQILVGDSLFGNYTPIDKTRENYYFDSNVSKFNNYYYKLRIINEDDEPISDYFAVLEVKAVPDMEDE